MATWKDGPRYAPVDRPTGFAQPAVEIGLTAPEAPPSLPSAPPTAPETFTATPDQPGLEQILPAEPSPRDPQTPFAVAAAQLTNVSQAVDSPELIGNRDRLPTQPFAVVSADPGSASMASGPRPFTDSLPAPTGSPVNANARPGVTISLADCWKAAYPPFVILLVVVGLVASVEPLFAVVALIASPFFFIPRVRYRVTQLRIGLGVVGAVLALLWLVETLSSSSMYNTDLHLNWWVAAGCWALAITDMVLQWRGMSVGDKPNLTN
ncbi:MAG: hypothetical protein LBV06_02190 [Propionibacteriaceae bacterium]|nr:hypothetical protein [Propionibacteriaceae bacterium]